MKSCLFFSILAALCGMTAGLIREYAFFNISMNWTAANSYCIYKRYLGLAYITTAMEQDRLEMLAGHSTGWIGMYRSSVNTTWLWYPSVSNNFYFWRQGESNDAQDLDCVFSGTGGWDNQFCGESMPFYCYRNLILVKQNMTWLEAFQYCRSRYAILAVINSDMRTQLATIEGAPSETNSLWTGLRFLNGYWFWVFAGELQRPPVPLLSCPAIDSRCAAFNPKATAWEFRNCEEKLNFFCY